MKAKKTILLWCLCSLSLWAGAQESMKASETVEHNFSVDGDDRLEVENKYGDVIIEQSSSDALKIRVEISYSGGNASAIDELQDFIDVTVNKNGSFIIAKTDWGKNASFFTKSLEGIKNIFDGDRSVEVNYYITAPTYLDMRITNKFGDIFVGEHDGRVDIDLSHGDLRSRRIAFPEKVSVSYGKMIVDEWGTGKVEVFFGEIDSKSAENLTINSKSSEIKFEKADRLDFQSRNDEIHIKEVNTVTGNYRFTKTQIDVLNQKAIIEQNFGDLRVDELDDGFETVELRLRKADVTLIAKEYTAFNFLVYLTDGETFSSVPDLITLKRDEQIGDARQMEGYWKSPHPTRKISVWGESSVVNIAKE